MNEAAARGVGVNVVMEEWAVKVVRDYWWACEQLGDGKECEVWKKFVKGFLMFRIDCSRYKLRDIGFVHIEE